MIQRSSKGLLYVDLGIECYLVLFQVATLPKVKIGSKLRNYARTANVAEKDYLDSTETLSTLLLQDATLKMVKFEIIPYVVRALARG